MYWIPLVITMTLFPSVIPIQDKAECQTEMQVSDAAIGQGYTNQLALRGDKAKSWMLAYAEVVQANPADVLDVSVLVFLTNPKDTSVVVATAYKDGCYVGFATIPAEMMQKINDVYLKGGRGA